MMIATSLLALAAGAFVYTLVEYVHHRHAGHLGVLGARLRLLHLGHHADPLEGGVTYAAKVKQRAPLVVVSLCAFGAIYAAVLPAICAAAAAAGMLGAYLFSEWFHHAIHHRAPRNRWERFMWRYHYVHHFSSTRRNYGFTTPLWDFVFRTALLRLEVVVPGQSTSPSAVEVPGVTVAQRRSRPTP